MREGDTSSELTWYPRFDIVTLPGRTLRIRNAGTYRLEAFTFDEVTEPILRLDGIDSLSNHIVVIRPTN